MKIDAVLENKTPDDAQLVGQCLAGNREAFGQIVARYQSPICALAYNACGDVARSEDLAQEIFLAAWRQLRDLKDPGKLRAWLYGIARNLINKGFGQQTRNPLAAADPLDEVLEPDLALPDPADAAISKEEAAILWRVVGKLPATYREPMILFYRQEESIAEVAETMAVSEEVVRQRLSRGRAMLNERVAKFVEAGLRRSGPTKVFGVAVLAGLPVASAKAAAAGAATATATGSGMAKGAGLAGAVVAAAASLASMAGAVVAFRGRVENARSPRERKFLAQAGGGYLAWVAIWPVLVRCLLMQDQNGVLCLSLVGCALAWLLLIGPFFAFGLWVTRRQIQIQVEDGTSTASQSSGSGDARRKGNKAIVYGTLAALIFSSAGWLLMVSQRTEDQLLLAVLPVVAIATWLLSARAALSNPEKSRTVYLFVWWGLTIFVLALVNLRWNFWHRNAPTDQSADLHARLGVNFLIFVVYGSLGLARFAKQRLIVSRKI